MTYSTIKKIDVGQLEVGMYIHRLVGEWMSHPFFRNSFLVTSENDIRNIINAGIHDVYIDSRKGKDQKDAPTEEEVAANIESSIISIAEQQTTTPVRTPFAEEERRAYQIKLEAKKQVTRVMRDVRMGKAVDLDHVEDIVQGITDSILRNSGALVSLLRIKNRDDYTFMHSISACALMVAFCKSVGMNKETTRQAGLGGLLHDTGKAMISNDILKKPGRLTEKEFDIMKHHPKDGYDILMKTPNIGQIPLEIALHHHERMDGSGYPDNQPASEISTLVQMAAIVDVYDAITSDRCYHAAIHAAEALRKIYEWSDHHFNPRHVHAFIRCVGIYPVGTLVLLESGRMGVVMEPHETNLLAPKVNVFFSTKSHTHITPTIVDLSKPLGSGGGDRIVSHESPEKWDLEPKKFLHVA
jgi:HD-GYP domain-containing protein (c-di-GMP phosphodiesterase class II)